MASVGIDLITPVIGVSIASMAILFASDCDNGLPHADESQPRCSVVVPLTILELGFIAGPVFDGALVAQRRVRPAEPRATDSGLRWTPWFLPTYEQRRQGAVLGISGAF